MSASLFDSPLHAELFPTGDTARLFADSAVLRAMLLVEAALARAQGQLGLIPDISAAAINRAAHEVQIDPAALAQATGQNGVSVPALVAAFRAEMNAPEHAQFIHWGATSQDILDTALMLRMRQMLALAEKDLRTLLSRFADMAVGHADTVMAARTYGQLATPTTWGAQIAQWGNPLFDALQALEPLRASSLWVSLSGAAGTSAVWGQATPELRKAFATELGLGNPERSWHTDRGPVLRLAGWMSEVISALGAFGSSLAGLAASGVDEVRFAAAGESSTMPQKQNPVAASALTAIVLQMGGIHTGLIRAASHQHQRDGSAWFAEWMLLPQLALSTAASLQLALRLCEEMRPDTEAMAQNLDADLGLIHAEALVFALAKTMPRPDAQTEVKSLCAEALRTTTHLRDLVTARYPQHVEAVFTRSTSVGRAPDEAREFAQRVRML